MEIKEDKNPPLILHYTFNNKPKQVTIDHSYGCKLLDAFFETGDTQADLPKFGDVFEWIMRTWKVKDKTELMRAWDRKQKYFLIGLAYLGNTELMLDWDSMWRKKMGKDVRKEITKYFGIMVTVLRKIDRRMEEQDDDRGYEKLSVVMSLINSYLCKNNSVNEDFFRKHKNIIVWESITLNTNLPVSFFKENLSKINGIWNESIKLRAKANLCSNTNMTESFLISLIESNDYQHEKCWEEFCKNPVISEKFFEDCLKYKRYLDKLNWNSICANTSLSADFFEKCLESKEYEPLINWEILCQNKALPASFFERYINQVDWETICCNPNLGDEFFERYLNPRYRYEAKMNWMHLSSNTGLSTSFFTKYKEKLDWRSISQNPSVSPRFLMKNIDKVYWSFLCVNTGLNDLFFEYYLRPTSKYKNRIDWYALSKNNCISEQFVKRHKKHIIHTVFENNNMSPKFLFNELYTTYRSPIDNSREWTHLGINNFEKYIEGVVDIRIKQLYKRFVPSKIQQAINTRKRKAKKQFDDWVKFDFGLF